MKPVRFLLPAEQEMLEAAHYYETRSPGLGQDFLNRIESAVKDVRANPQRWPVIGRELRRRSVHRYPYCLLYRDDSDAVLVLAVMHLRRRPGYWAHRISSEENPE